MLLTKEEDQRKGCGGESARSRGPVGGRGAVAVPAGVLRLVDRPGGCAVRADRGGVVRRRAGALAGRAEPAGRAPPRPWRAVRRPQSRPGGAAADPPGGGGGSAAPGRGW